MYNLLVYSRLYLGHLHEPNMSFASYILSMMWTCNNIHPGMKDRHSGGFQEHGNEVFIFS